MTDVKQFTDPLEILAVVRALEGYGLVTTNEDLIMERLEGLWDVIDKLDAEEPA